METIAYYVTRYSYELVGYKRVWDRYDRKFYEEPIYERRPYLHPVYRFSARWRASIQRRGPYRKGTSYRRNPDHLSKERDVNKDLWRRSRQDWRHARGHPWRGCSGCSACVRWEVLCRGAERAERRTFVQSLNGLSLDDLADEGHLQRDLYIR